MLRNVLDPPRRQKGLLNLGVDKQKLVYFDGSPLILSELVESIALFGDLPLVINGSSISALQGIALNQSGG